MEPRYNLNIFALNGDDFKEFYPKYEELLTKNPDQAAQEVQPYSNYVVNELKKEYSEKNLI